MQRFAFFGMFGLEKVVFANINGFIKRPNSSDPLEKTRINKDQSKTAKIICN